MHAYDYLHAKNMVFKVFFIELISESSARSTIQTGNPKPDILFLRKQKISNIFENLEEFETLFKMYN